MKKLALILLGVLAACNLFLGWSGGILVHEMGRSYRHHGSRDFSGLPALTLIAMSAPPWFYGMLGATLIFGCVAMWKKLSPDKVIFGAFTLIFVDAFVLFVSLWGLCVPYFLMCCDQVALPAK
jgi:hypothetical protein